MSKRVANKVALITGAASGLGKATAERLAQEGASVILSDINADAGRAATDMITATGATATFMPLDTTSEAGWDETVAQVLSRYGKLDVLFNNAGIGIIDASPIDEMSFDTWRKTLAVNLDGVFLGLRAGIRAMKQNPLGSNLVLYSY